MFEFLSGTFTGLNEVVESVSSSVKQAVASEEATKITSDDVVSFFREVGETIKTTIENEAQFIFEEQLKINAQEGQATDQQEVKAPWEDLPFEDKQMANEIVICILEIGKHKKNILDIPPQIVHAFPFVFRERVREAKMVLDKDPLLAKLCFKLVPIEISEELFWKNYFCRVEMIKQAFGCSSQQAVEQAPVDEKPTPVIAVLESKQPIEEPLPLADQDGADQLSLEFASDLYGTSEWPETNVSGWEEQVTGFEDELEIVSVPETK